MRFKTAEIYKALFKWCDEVKNEFHLSQHFLFWGDENFLETISEYMNYKGEAGALYRAIVKAKSNLIYNKWLHSWKTYNQKVSETEPIYITRYRFDDHTMKRYTRVKDNPEELEEFIKSIPTN